MFDMTVTNPLTADRLDAAQLRPGDAMEQGIKRNEQKYHDSHHSPSKALP